MPIGLSGGFWIARLAICRDRQDLPKYATRDALAPQDFGPCRRAFAADGWKDVPKAHAPRSINIGDRYRGRLHSARYNVLLSTVSWGAGRSIHLPPMWPSI